MLKNRETYESLAHIRIEPDDTVTLLHTLHTSDNAAVRGITHLGNWSLPIDEALYRIRKDGFWSAWIDQAKYPGNNLEQTVALNENAALVFMRCNICPVLTCDNLQSASLIENLKPGEYVFGVLSMPEGIAVNVHLHEIIERIFRRSRLLDRMKSGFSHWEEQFPSRLIDYESEATDDILQRMEKAVAKLRITMPSYSEEKALDKIIEEYKAEINGFYMGQLLLRGDCVELIIAPHVAGRGLPFKVQGVIMEARDNSVSIKHPKWDTLPTWVQLRFVNKVNMLTQEELTA